MGPRARACLTVSMVIVGCIPLVLIIIIVHVQIPVVFIAVPVTFAYLVCCMFCGVAAVSRRHDNVDGQSRRASQAQRSSDTSPESLLALWRWRRRAWLVMLRHRKLRRREAVVQSWSHGLRLKLRSRGVVQQQMEEGSGTFGGLGEEGADGALQQLVNQVLCIEQEELFREIVLWL